MNDDQAKRLYARLMAIIIPPYMLLIFSLAYISPVIQARKVLWEHVCLGVVFFFMFALSIWIGFQRTRLHEHEKQSRSDHKTAAKDLRESFLHRYIDFYCDALLCSITFSGCLYVVFVPFGIWWVRGYFIALGAFSVLLLFCRAVCQYIVLEDDPPLRDSQDDS